MQIPSDERNARLKAGVAILLTFTAGLVDIVGYIAVYHSFVAHMTGATVHLGNDLVTHVWPQAGKAAAVIASFVGGSIVGRTMIEWGARARMRTAASVTMAAEAALVLAFIWDSTAVLKHFAPQNIPLGTSCLLLALLASAMGLQTATLTRIGPLTVHTTFVTGMLNKLAEEAARWIFWIHDSRQEHQNVLHLLRSSRDHRSFRNSIFLSGIWISYMLGSMAGTWMDSRWKVDTLYLAVFILLCSIGADQLRPLSLEEEREQSRSSS